MDEGGLVWFIDIEGNVYLRILQKVMVWGDFHRLKPELQTTKYKLCKWTTLNEKKKCKENGIEINLLEDDLVNIKFSKNFSTFSNKEYIVGKDSSKCRQIVEK